jgi:chromosome partitioning protein
MSVIAIVNRKGGSGKSTVATHVAAWLATQGLTVMLGDVDRQQSSVSWLKRRSEQKGGGALAPILGWAVDARNVLRPPTGVAHVVLDTPGGLHGLEMSRMVVYADAMLIPVCDSAFDRDAAAACLADLRAHPRVASGRVRVAALGMRIDSRTHAAAGLEKWAQGLDLPFLGVLRAAQSYVRCIEQGLTHFDLPASRAQQDVEQWGPVIAWVREVIETPSERRPTVPAREAIHPTPRIAAAASKAAARPASAPPPLTPLVPLLEKIAPPRGALAGMRRLLGWI